MLTTKQAAEILGYNEGHIRRIAKRLGGEKIGRDWFFEEANIKKYIKPRPGAKKEQSPT